jgi:hypothetical protein
MERKSPEEHAQREIAHKFGWLAIQFPSSEGELNAMYRSLVYST